jgi:hypothetical protein
LGFRQRTVQEVHEGLKPAYPEYYYRTRWRGFGTYLLIILGLTVFTLLYGLVLLVGVGTGWQVFGFCLSLFLLCLLLWGEWHGRKLIRVIPIYDSRVPEVDTFLTGFALARNCTRLDALAQRCSAKPVSAFGFDDPLYGEKLVWHDASEGLRTVEALIATLNTDREAVDDINAVLSDLDRVKNALAAATEKGVRFALLVEVGEGTSGLVWERRKAWF